ncbi:hypothetical protein AB0J82_37610 [Asanoa sp. NPDC049518]|uniref:hypothetical protein n=1 Tax=unclassified Asanoa TaxID=2685164 RepID=UPI00343060AC
MTWIRRTAVAGIVWCAGVLAVSTIPGMPPLPSVVGAPAFLLVMPSFAVVVFASVRLALRETGSRRRAHRALLRLLSERLPIWALLASILLFVGFWLVASQSLAGAASGVPKQLDGAYILNNDGHVIEISEDEYLRLQEQGQRTFVAMAGAFGVVAAVLSTAFVRPEERPETSATPRGPAPG